MVEQGPPLGRGRAARRASKLAEDAARPILYHSRSGTCWQPYVKGYTTMLNSIYNGLHIEDVWLDS
jgi:peptide/nickel transport system substrate-binding protein